MTFINKNSDFFFFLTYRSEKEGIYPFFFMPILHKISKGKFG